MKSSNSVARKRLLESALKCFSEKGFLGASVNEIVARAGVSKPALYYYFRDKEALYLTILDQGLMELESRFRLVAQSEDSPQKRLGKLIDCYFKYMNENEARARIIFESWAGSVGARMRELLRENYSRLLRVVTGVFREGIISGVFRSGDPNLLGLLLLGVLQTRCLAGHSISRPYSSDEIREITELCLNGVAA